MRRYEPSTSPCPIGRASRLLGDRWVMLVLREAFLGSARFEEFMDRLPISRAALSSRLAMMVDGGILVRDPPVGKRANYALTDAGHALEPMFREMAEWGARHMFAADEAGDGWKDKLPSSGA